MPYTAWNETTPAGASAVSAGDDAIRSLKVQIRERMNDILAAGGQWDVDDPILLSTTAIGVRTGVEIFFSHHLMVSQDSTDNFLWGEGYWTSDISNGKMSFMPISLPVGSVIQSVNVLINRGGTTSIDIGLFYNTHSVTPATTQSTGAALTAWAGTGLTDLVVGTAMAHTVAADRYYYMKFTKNGGTFPFLLYGVKITVDLASLAAYV